MFVAISFLFSEINDVSILKKKRIRSNSDKNHDHLDFKVGKVATTNDHNKIKRAAVVDELSTIPGAIVTVTPSGTVKVKRSAGR